MPHPKHNKTSFKPGRNKTGGRKAGVRNKATEEMGESTREVLDMIKQAAERIGSDTAGTDGMVGYLQTIALCHPRSFAKLLGQLLEQEIEDERVNGAGCSPR